MREFTKTATILKQSDYGLASTKILLSIGAHRSNTENRKEHTATTKKACNRRAKFKTEEIEEKKWGKACTCFSYAIRSWLSYQKQPILSKSFALPIQYMHNNVRHRTHDIALIILSMFSSVITSHYFCARQPKDVLQFIYGAFHADLFQLFPFVLNSSLQNSKFITKILNGSRYGKASQ